MTETPGILKGGSPTIAFGPMRLSTDLPLPSRERAIATICAALDAGATVFDTADCYGPSPAEAHHNEALLAEAIARWGGPRDAILLATKSGNVRTSGGWARDGRPEHIRAACERSLRALGVSRIDLYQLHGPDAAVPFADQVGALARLREEGKVGAVGLSNVGRRQLAEARAIVPIASVQNRYSIWAREAEGLLSYCTAEDIAFLAWSPLGGAGHVASLPVLDGIATARGVSVQQVALAWLLARSPVMIPIVGATRPETARDSLAAVALRLTAEEKAAIDAALPHEQLAPIEMPSR
ncbi:aldo/keto reductase [uncultured Sphingomonas sp.]|uniref:aldo/keto reductase n=1 Tax=uncultured Sphingomonas sp. TaxID=158754 RepID=UPI0035CAB050